MRSFVVVIVGCTDPLGIFPHGGQHLNGGRIGRNRTLGKSIAVADGRTYFLEDSIACIVVIPKEIKVYVCQWSTRASVCQHKIRQALFNIRDGSDRRN